MPAILAPERVTAWLDHPNYRLEVGVSRFQYRRVADPQLRSDLAAALKDPRRTSDFGLIFESHLPESVRLAQHPVRRGVKVALKDADHGSIWGVYCRASRAKSLPCSHVSTLTLVLFKREI